jgi:hypothetical protein
MPRLVVVVYRWLDLKTILIITDRYCLPLCLAETVMYVISLGGYMSSLSVDIGQHEGDVHGVVMNESRRVILGMVSPVFVKNSGREVLSWQIFGSFDPLHRQHLLFYSSDPSAHGNLGARSDSSLLDYSL